MPAHALLVHVVVVLVP
ncbi:hypothetical protein, partial [Frankia sp. AvcI1]